MPTIAARARQVYVCAADCYAAARHIGARPAFRRLPPRLSQGLPSLTQLQAMLPGTWTAPMRHRGNAALPAPSCPSPVTAPHASAVIPKGMMPKAAPERVASPRGGTALAPLPKVPSRRRPSMSEILQFVTVMGTIVKSCPDFDDQAHGA